ncbi:RMD5 homolog A-like protein [Babesia ovata]|uniref:RMD5 homolog A-like protein n=1 Tax=Babesia ovata TaxID=189622 RepID=A0A2H6KBT8_9APIC|nr:RMD5 homolog A-like protein [Babesia ovata]GBE60455.1 RMD5 homolog A-like protein [Babesia ovata]
MTIYCAEANTRDSSKRTYQAAMGSLIQDAISLDKRRKLLFSNLYSHIDSLRKVVEDAVVTLSDVDSVDKLAEESTLTSTHTAVDNASGEPSASVVNNVTANHEGSSAKPTESCADKGQHDVGYRSTLADLSKAVKSLDVHRIGNKSTKEFKNQYLKFGKDLFKSGHGGDNEVLPLMDFDDQLVIQMIGMHFLHYGMFDVYEGLKAEAAERWGADSRAKVSGAVVSAYRILHDMLAKLRSNDINPLIDWVKLQMAESHLHADRFNALLLNLYKVQLLGDLYVFRDGEMHHQDFYLTPERILKVKASGLSQMWKSHNANIGKLLTQVLLGQNLPSAAEFLRLRFDAEKLFVRIFCESGVRIKKQQPITTTASDTSKRARCEGRGRERNHGKETTEDKSKVDVAANHPAEVELDPDDYLVRKKLPPEVKKVAASASWLGILEARCTSSGNSSNRESVSQQPERAGRCLYKGWMQRLEGEELPRRCPRVPFSRLRSPALSQSTDIKDAKMELLGRKTSRRQFYFTETIDAMNSDPETVCRQLIPNRPLKLDSNTVVHDESDATENHDDCHMSSDEGETEDDSFLNVSHLSQLALLAEYPLFMQRGLTPQSAQEFNLGSSPDDPHQTLSLTVFAGPPVVPEEPPPPQPAENDSSSGGVSGRRIRITFPTRSDVADLLPSQGRRSAFRGLRSSAEETEPTSPGTGSSSTSRVEGERPTAPREPTNINVRGILRMIMRGIAGDSSNNADTVVQLSPNMGGVLPSSGVRNENVATTRPAVATTQPAAPRPKQGSFRTAYEREDTDDYVRVFLPYERCVWSRKISRSPQPDLSAGLCRLPAASAPGRHGGHTAHEQAGVVGTRLMDALVQAAAHRVGPGPGVLLPQLPNVPYFQGPDLQPEPPGEADVRARDLQHLR